MRGTVIFLMIFGCSFLLLLGENQRIEEKQKALNAKLVTNLDEKGAAKSHKSKTGQQHTNFRNETIPSFLQKRLINENINLTTGGSDRIFVNVKEKNKGEAIILTLAILLAVFGLGFLSVLIICMWYRYRPRMNGYIRVERDPQQSKDNSNVGQGCNRLGYTSLDLIEEGSCEATDANVFGGEHLENRFNDNKPFQMHLPDKDVNTNRHSRRWSQPSWTIHVGMPNNDNKKDPDGGPQRLERDDIHNSDIFKPAKGLDKSDEARLSGDSNHDTDIISNNDKFFQINDTSRRTSHSPWQSTSNGERIGNSNNDSDNNQPDKNYKRLEFIKQDSEFEGAVTTGILFLAKSSNLANQSSETSERNTELAMIKGDEGEDMSDSREDLMRQWIKSRRKSTRAAIYCVSSDSDEDFMSTDDNVSERKMELGKCELAEEQVRYFNYSTNESNYNDHFHKQDSLTGSQFQDSSKIADMDLRLGNKYAKTKRDHEVDYADNNYDSEEDIMISESKYYDITERDKISLMTDSDELLKGLMLGIHDLKSHHNMFNKKMMFKSSSDSDLSKYRNGNKAETLTNLNSFSTSNLRSKHIMPFPSILTEEASKSLKTKKERRSFSKKLKSFRKLFRKNNKKKAKK